MQYSESGLLEISEQKAAYSTCNEAGALENLILRRLREERKVSQRELARRIQKPRGYVQRLEENGWRSLSLGDLFDISQALHLCPEDLFAKIQNLSRDKISLKRCSLENPVTSRKLAEGVELCGLMADQASPLSFQILKMQPRSICSGEWIPKGDLFTLLVLKGCVTLNICGQEMVFKEKDFLEPDLYLPKEFYNPDPMKPFWGLVFTAKE